MLWRESRDVGPIGQFIQDPAQSQQLKWYPMSCHSMILFSNYSIRPCQCVYVRSISFCMCLSVFLVFQIFFQNSQNLPFFLNVTGLQNVRCKMKKKMCFLTVPRLLIKKTSFSMRLGGKTKLTFTFVPDILLFSPVLFLLLSLPYSITTLSPTLHCFIAFSSGVARELLRRCIPDQETDTLR